MWEKADPDRCSSPADKALLLPELFVKHADDFKLTRHEAVERIRIVDEAVSHWREDAGACGVQPDALQ